MSRFQSSTSVIEARQKDLSLVIALLPASEVPEITPSGTEEGMVPSSAAVGWLAIDEDYVIEFNAIQNGSLVRNTEYLLQETLLAVIL